MKITLYGGVNEIGGNKFLVEDGEERILLDFGTSIGARNEFFEEFLPVRTNAVLRDLLRLGLLPDVDGIYREDFLTIAKSATDKDLPESANRWKARTGKPFVQGILLTHAHVDHFQDISFLDPEIPVYCTPTTRRMIEAIEDVKGAKVDGEIATARWRSVGAVKGGYFPGSPTVESDDLRPRTFVDILEGVNFRVGGFEVTPIPVDHSVPGGVAFYIRAPSGKTIFYTGDVRFHGRLMDRTSMLLKLADGLAPDVLLTEGTRLDSTKLDSEDDVERGVADLAKDTAGKLLVAEFGWKDTTRFDTLQRVAEMSGRTLLIDARLAYMLHKLDGTPGFTSRRMEAYPNVRCYVRRKKSLLGTPGDLEGHERGYEVDWAAAKKAGKDKDDAWLEGALAHARRGVTADAVRENPSKYIVHLTYFGSNELFDLAPPEGSRWIRCSTEPYSDEMAMDLQKQRNWLSTFDMEDNIQKSKRTVGVEEDGALVAEGRITHISGHGAGPDLLKLAKSIAPKMIVPVHVEAKNADRYAGLAGDVRTFAGARWREAGKGKCVVEL